MSILQEIFKAITSALLGMLDTILQRYERDKLVSKAKEAEVIEESAKEVIKNVEKRNEVEVINSRLLDDDIDRLMRPPTPRNKNY